MSNIRLYAGSPHPISAAFEFYNPPEAKQTAEGALSCYLWYCISPLDHHAGLLTPENHFSPRSPLKASVREEHSFPHTYRKTHKTYISNEMALAPIALDHLLQLKESRLSFSLSGCHSLSSFSRKRNFALLSVILK